MPMLIYDLLIKCSHLLVKTLGLGKSYSMYSEPARKSSFK